MVSVNGPYWRQDEAVKLTVLNTYYYMAGRSNIRMKELWLSATNFVVVCAFFLGTKFPF